MEYLQHDLLSQLMLRLARSEDAVAFGMDVTYHDGAPSTRASVRRELWRCE
jgi:hypothetical protein